MAREESPDREPPDFVGFDWDEGNLLKSWEKHCVTSAEAEEVFRNDPLISEVLLSQGEKRWFALGVTNGGRLLTIVYTMSGDWIRVISARPMSRRERRKFEKR